MRADARENRDSILMRAREVVAERGVDASLRDIARQAGVGLATLLRHFPTRATLLEALLRASLDDLTGRAAHLEASVPPDDALASWMRDAVAFVRIYSGVVSAMAAGLADPDSALHASCERLRAAGARLLRRAQSEGTARSDMGGDEVFALIGALGWIGDQPAFAPLTERLSKLVIETILKN